MAIIKCKMCGGDVVLTEDKTVGICEYCGSTMTFPKITDEQRTAAFNRGNAFRRAGEFDKALAVYERIVAEDDSDAEAHWCCALCRFGIEWVEDPNTYEYVPTCHRASFDSFLEDVDYKAALQYSDGVTRRQYQRDGARINEVQRGILATSQHEKPFDVFICYKELDDDGNRTRDSIDAQEIYYNLTQEGYRVFFSRITLEDKVGTEYEPYIFAALNSAKVMVVLGSKPEYFNAVWVKNEWSRYLTLMHKDRSKLLLPCYKNMDPYDLPDQLSVLMSYDMTKIGFMQDLLRGIRKVIRKDEPKPAVKEPVIIQQSAGPNVDSLLRRVFIFLEGKNWQSADEYCERVLDQAPENATAYLGKLMAELNISKREQLQDLDEPFDDRENYQWAIRFGDDALRDELESYNAAIRARLEEKRKAKAYAGAQTAAQRARTEREYIDAAAQFDALSGFRDARRQAEVCREKAETARKAALFEKAASAMNAAADAGAYEKAARLFNDLSGFRDAEQKAALCLEKAEEKRLEAEKRKAEAEEKRLAEERRKAEAEEKRRREQEAKKAAAEAKAAVVIQPKRSKTVPVLVSILALLLIAGAVFVWKLPEIKQAKANKQAYEQADALLEAGDYFAARAAFIELGDYKDSKARAAEIKEIQFQRCDVGDYVVFGAFEQDNNTINGKEDLAWLVLAKENSRILVISRYGLDCLRYNTLYDTAEWGISGLRRWLNGRFLNDAFSDEEKAMIPSVTVSEDENPGSSANPESSTEDQVFLLSMPEVKQYFASIPARQCMTTEYANVRGGYNSNFNTDFCNWWLRSPGSSSDRAAFVNSSGAIDEEGFWVKFSIFVRPAMWIDLNAIDEGETPQADDDTDSQSLEQLIQADGIEAAVPALESNGAMYANHILLLTVDPATGEALDDAGSAQKKAQAEQLAAELQGISNPEERLNRFLELKAQFDEDVGKEANPNGYLFYPGTMAAEFEDACGVLGEYEVSAPVLSSYGYHVIIRLPFMAYRSGTAILQGN